MAQVPPPPGPPPGQPPSQPHQQPGTPPPQQYQGGPPTPYGPKLSPQGLPLAEWWQRALAAVIDWFILTIPSWIIMVIFSIGTFSSADFTIETDVQGNVTRIEGGGGFFGGFIVSWLVLSLLGIAYYVYFHGNDKGQTVGKMAMKIAVKDEATGGSIGYGRAALRWLITAVLWALCGVPGVIDHLFPLWDDKRQALHDKPVNSLVVGVG